MLTTGRNFVHYHTGTLTRQSHSLDDEQKEGYAEINPLDAQKYGISYERQDKSYIPTGSD